MDRVVGYDYPIDNKEEMKMENVRIEDVTGDESEVCVISSRTGDVKTIVSLDFDPDDYGECISMMHYTPGDARKLAAALIMAADEAEKQ